MITRDNYEEFFLLYMDNELSMADRLAVEQWAGNNPDLRDEWESLSLSRLTPDSSLVFPARETLLKRELFIDESNYETQFLSLVDGELNEKEKAEAVEFINRYPAKLPELDLLWQTVSSPDTGLLFPDKESLYRSEKDKTPVLLFWLRIPAAAALLGVIGLLILLTRHRDDTGYARNLITTHKAMSGPTSNAAPTAPAASAAIARAAAGGNIPPEKKDLPAVTTPATPALHSIEGQPVTLAAATGEKKTGKTDGRLPADVAGGGSPGQNSGANGMPGDLDRQTRMPVFPVHPAVTTRELAVPASTGTDPAKAVIPPAETRQVAISREQSSFATQALLKEEADNNGQGLLASDEPASTGKSKFRGIFRKVTRAFGKTADRDNEGQREILIGAFQLGIK
jgi:hypothetical protein